MVTALDWRFSIGGLQLGGGTNFRVTEWTSETELEVHDTRNAAADGIRFGRDTRGGSVHTMEIAVTGSGPESVLANLEKLQAIWLGDAARQNPGVVIPLRITRPGRVDTVVFGRPRKLTASTMADVGSGYVPVVADFQAADHLFYAADEVQNSISVRPSTAGSFTVPARVPWRSAKLGPSTQTLVPVDGSSPTWLRFDIFGPISQPVVSVAGQFTISLNSTLAAGQRLILDPRPWLRGIRTETGANGSGMVSASSPRLSDMRVSPGQHTVTIRGTDQTGTSGVLVRHRAAYSSL